MIDPMFLVLLFAPLIGSMINGARWKDKNVKVAGMVASAAVLSSFVGAIYFFFKLKGLTPEARSLTFKLFDWITVGSFNVEAAFTIDPLSSVMILIITGVGFLIHLFSMGYMDHDERPAKYFSYLNFFIFNMLLLVLGSNLLVMFVGWEGVGLCSYLLIGFWFTDKEKAAAGMKAFITNRIGDAGFLLGIFLLATTLGTINFGELATQASGLEMQPFSSAITLACLFLFVGACGKSAQIPLYVWLPDAMAGPTPVSALIHAATMVTAGVYMIIRLNVLYVAAPGAMAVVACVGAATALLAATIGIAQNDIKKVLAYSTVSQLGYMFLAVGVGAFGAGLAHLMTHAFFKALMFLGAGSVIYGMHHEQDMRKMGGLRKQMPVTHATFVCGWLAIIGMPFFSGFFSKDEILWMAFHSPRGHVFLWAIGVIAALCTAFYMTRLMALTFWSPSRVAADVKPHESPKIMTVPLMVLAFLSVFAGWLCVPHGLGSVLPGHPHNFLEDWISPVVKQVPNMEHGSLALEFGLMGLVLALVAGSVYLAIRFYVANPETPEKIKASAKGLYDAVANKYWVDEFYFAAFINPLVKFSQTLWSFFDVKIVDGTTYRLSNMIRNASGGLKAIQTGNMQMYALYILIGIVGSLFFLMTR